MDLGTRSHTARSDGTAAQEVSGMACRWESATIGPCKHARRQGPAHPLQRVCRLRDGGGLWQGARDDGTNEHRSHRFVRLPPFPRRPDVLTRIWTFSPAVSHAEITPVSPGQPGPEERRTPQGRSASSSRGCGHCGVTAAHLTFTTPSGRASSCVKLRFERWTDRWGRRLGSRLLRLHHEHPDSKWKHRLGNAYPYSTCA